MNVEWMIDKNLRIKIEFELSLAVDMQMSVAHPRALNSIAGINKVNSRQQSMLEYRSCIYNALCYVCNI